MTLYNHYLECPDDDTALTCAKKAIGKAVMVGYSLGAGSNTPVVILTLPEGQDPLAILPECKLIKSLSLDDVMAEQKAEEAHEQPSETEAGGEPTQSNG